ncbi:MAG: proline dehydrogenase family protein, partial [Bacteroidales bacterium]|nr:proline dehydrogenase family protein [Bacteroidales bacterium]
MTDFTNTEIAFVSKTNKDLKKALLLYKIMASPFITKTAKILTQIALAVRFPISWIVKPTIYNHFVGGETIDECIPTIKLIGQYGVKSILDYSVEGKENEAQFDIAVNKTLEIIEFASNKESMPIAVFKPTGFGRLDLYEKKGSGIVLTADEQDEWNKIVTRYHKVCKLAKEKDVEVLIDAEESWMQDAADALVEEMMKIYNTEKPIVYNTLQAYRWDRFDYLKA